MSDHQTILFGSNASFVEGLYEDYLADPASVPDAWRKFFDTQRAGAPDVPHTGVQAAFAELARQGAHRVVAQAPAVVVGMGAADLIASYRVLGHLKARFNPLEPNWVGDHPELTPDFHGLTAEDMAAPAVAGPFKGPLKDVQAALERTYCGPIGFEFMHLPRAERLWMQERIEAWGGGQAHDAATRRRILTKLNAAEGLERYLHKRYVGQKRFSLEGGEALIPRVDLAIQRGGAQGVKEVVIGMAHRGRLNVLVNIMGKKASELFNEFEGKKIVPADIAGDVKYHMGFSSDVDTPAGKVHLSLGFNPSHLELIDPVVEGSVRARQDRRNDEAGTTVLPVLIHGDAAVIGQGVVAETLNLSQLRGFKTGGTLHLVVNNQVGFSVSDPRDTRSSRYCTDLGKMSDCPAFHVNGDDPDACVFATLLALEYRQVFKKDVFIDLVCFRRHGHNEADEPRATQPQMYHVIDTHPGTRQVYADRLEKEQVIRAGEAQKLVDEYRDLLDAGARTVDASEVDLTTPGGAAWAEYAAPAPDLFAPVPTGVPADRLRALGQRLVTTPDGFVAHKRIQAVLDDRKKMLAGELPCDWGFAENLAYASLAADGHPLRLTGQDVGRGTFFHRHAIIHDQRPEVSYLEKAYTPLKNLTPDQARVDVIDSTLSEEAVLAFEYGYSSTEPRALVIWEAQYGDFANMAQAVIDQYIVAGEIKWQRLCGLVMLLPHGYEGQGPEHSSARLERFLMLSAENNMQVVVPSSAAQIFHLLRRQIVRKVRKPLVVMSPKSMLRNKGAAVPLEALTTGHFQEVIGDPARPADVERVVLCSGKLYYDLVEAREKHGKRDVAIVRIEQLYPFPADQVRHELAKFIGARAVVWAQEEPANNGAWGMIRDELATCLAPGQELTFASRPRSSSPAVGYLAKHNEQQQALIDQALGGARVAETSKA